MELFIWLIVSAIIGIVALGAYCACVVNKDMENYRNKKDKKNGK